MKYLLVYEIFENKSISIGGLLELENNIDHELINIIKKLISSGKILEISCGNGSDSIELNRLGYNVVSTENNINYVEYTNHFVKCIKHDTKDKFPFKDDEFDLTYSRLGLHYFTEEELYNIFNEIDRITKKYIVFTVKLTNNVETNKVIFDEKKWIDITSNYFKIKSSKIKTGLLYGIESRWLEIIGKKL